MSSITRIQAKRRLGISTERLRVFDKDGVLIRAKYKGIGKVQISYTQESVQALDKELRNDFRRSAVVNGRKK